MWYHVSASWDVLAEIYALLWQSFQWYFGRVAHDVLPGLQGTFWLFLWLLFGFASNDNLVVFLLYKHFCRPSGASLAERLVIIWLYSHLLFDRTAIHWLSCQQVFSGGCSNTVILWLCFEVCFGRASSYSITAFPLSLWVKLLKVPFLRFRWHFGRAFSDNFAVSLVTFDQRF
jgi:hypothetical protein